MGAQSRTHLPLCRSVDSSTHTFTHTQISHKWVFILTLPKYSAFFYFQNFFKYLRIIIRHNRKKCFSPSLKVKLQLIDYGWGPARLALYKPAITIGIVEDFQIRAILKYVCANLATIVRRICNSSAADLSTEFFFLYQKHVNFYPPGHILLLTQAHNI